MTPTQLAAFDVTPTEYELSEFARVIGDDPASTQVPPTYYFCLRSTGFDMLDALAARGCDPLRVLHAGQSFTFASQAYAGEVLSYTVSLTDEFDRKSGRLTYFLFETVVRGADDRLIVSMDDTIVSRNDSGAAG